jgi:putative aldouronate transport system permease protein
MKTKENIIFQTVSHFILIIMSLLVIIPFVLLVISSFASDKATLTYGYTFFPKAMSIQAYSYLWEKSSLIFRAYGITIFITLIGTILNIYLTAMLAYPLSRKDLPGRKGFTFIVFFTMLFNGGLVPTYLMYTQLFHIKDTIIALILPNLLMSAWWVLLARTFFMGNIPIEVIESGKIDGANEITIFNKIIMPLGKPIIATVGMFCGIAYWNDWYNGMIYLTDYRLFSLQNLLYRMLCDMQYLSSVTQMGGTSADAATQLPSSTVRMAIAVIGVVPIMLIYPFIQNNFAKGIAIGAVKG